MARRNPPQYHAADSDPPGGPDQDPDAAGDSSSCGGPDQDSRPAQGLLPNTEDPGPGDQEGQQPEELTDINAMRWDLPPPKIIERQECKHLLKRIGFGLETA